MGYSVKSYHILYGDNLQPHPAEVTYTDVVNVVALGVCAEIRGNHTV